MNAAHDQAVWWKGYYRALAIPPAQCYRCDMTPPDPVRMPFCTPCADEFDLLIDGRYGYT